MISIEALEFRYSAGSDELFGGLTHEFLTGAVSVVTGASGRGKSTLLYLLGLLLRPGAGSIAIDGDDVSSLGDGERSRIRSRTIGFVFQDAALDPTRSVIDNVVEGGIYAGIGRKRAESRGRELLQRFGVTLREDRKPGEVSGGQAQRVGLCRALLKEPGIVLADEPTGNLDADSADVVLAALRDAANAGAAVVIASHDPRVVEAADDVLAL